MDMTEVLDFVDQLVVEKTGKHLDDIQRIVIQGIWQRQNYAQIAEECHRSRGYVADIASQLFQLLAEEIGQDLRKVNFRSTLERINRNSSDKSNISGNICGNNNLVLQSVNQPDSDEKKQPKSQSKLRHYDLAFAPRLVKFYSRETELKSLKNWILEQNIPLISVLGLSGIGKSYLVKKFVDINLDRFEVIIWKSLQFPISLNLLLDEIFDIFPQEAHLKVTNNKIDQLLKLLRGRKCLIIFDNIENIFVEQIFAGECQAQYLDYQRLFRKITEITHQSSIILISQEKCQLMPYTDEEKSPIRILELLGLNGFEIQQIAHLSGTVAAVSKIVLSSLGRVK